MWLGPPPPPTARSEVSKLDLAGMQAAGSGSGMATVVPAAAAAVSPVVDVVAAAPAAAAAASPVVDVVADMGKSGQGMFARLPYLLRDAHIKQQAAGFGGGTAANAGP